MVGEGGYTGQSGWNIAVCWHGHYRFERLSIVKVCVGGDDGVVRAHVQRGLIYFGSYYNKDGGGIGEWLGLIMEYRRESTRITTKVRPLPLMNSSAEKQVVSESR